MSGSKALLDTNVLIFASKQKKKKKKLLLSFDSFHVPIITNQFTMHPYETITEALQDLRQRGFDQNFNLAHDCIECKDLNLKVYPENFKIVEFYRFEGMTDPGDNAIVYAVASDGGVQGVMVNAYGAYSDEMTDEMISKLSLAEGAGR